MQKIMFNDKYNLTSAVLEGQKTMTRRIIKFGDEIESMPNYGTFGDSQLALFSFDGREIATYAKSTYAVGDVVAIAQSYKAIKDEYLKKNDFAKANTVDKRFCHSNGWNNKMFVRADEMPHHIKITNIQVERLQDISNEDCMKEGIDYCDGYCESYYFGHGVKTGNGWMKLGNSPRSAFATLIDKVSSKGTWQSNHWVFVYEFELIN